MPRRAIPLTDRQIRQTKTPTVLIDGGGLRLRVETRTNAKDKTAVTRRWTLRVTVKGLGVREGGLGGYPAVTLARARDLAAPMREQARRGIDPFRVRKSEIEAERERAAAAAAQCVTFRTVCEDYLAAHAGSWRNRKHRQQWENTLRSTYGVLGDMPVSAITTEDVLRVLKPLWATTTETGSRLRGRIERVLASAIAKGLRGHPNPAAWRDNLQALLPPPRAVAPVEHHAALPYAELPAFLTALGAMPGMGAKALAFAILTAARSGEVRGMTWGELDLRTRAWAIPAPRMKAKRAHRVPLSDAALSILKAVKPPGGTPAPAALVFPGSRKGRAKRHRPRPALSDMTLTAVLKRMARAQPPTAPAGLTVHGFRSTFRDWCGGQTNFSREVAEAALAHAVGNKVEAAYARGDLFAKRAQLMAAWASYCERASGNGEVVDLSAKRWATRTRARAGAS